MGAIFIAGTGTDVGKTYVTAALIRALRRAGREVDALKPVVSGFDVTAPAGSDPAVLLEALGRAPLAPNQAARLEGRALAAGPVIDLCRARIAVAAETVLLIESAGGIMSPLDDAITMLDMAAALALPLLLVAGSYLGTISHTLTAVRVIEAAGLTLTAVVVSETADAPPLADTVAAIAGFMPATPVIPLPRGAEASPALVQRVTATFEALLAEA
jgi:dethiobiotin synthetase